MMLEKIFLCNNCCIKCWKAFTNPYATDITATSNSSLPTIDENKTVVVKNSTITNLNDMAPTVAGIKSTHTGGHTMVAGIPALAAVPTDSDQEQVTNADIITIASNKGTSTDENKNNSDLQEIMDPMVRFRSNSSLYEKTQAETVVDRANYNSNYNYNYNDRNQEPPDRDISSGNAMSTTQSKLNKLQLQGLVELTFQQSVPSAQTETNPSDKMAVDELKPYYISNPLVVMIGVGHYFDSGIWCHLTGIKNDYNNMITLFSKHWGYHFVYQTNKNKIVWVDPKKKIRQNFKIEWTYDEINTFINNIANIVKQLKYHDSLIFLISSHGDVDNVIIDSNGEEYQLMEIYDRFSNDINYGCPHLADKPKLFFVDACQGSTKPIPKGLLPTNKAKLKSGVATMQDTNTIAAEIKTKGPDHTGSGVNGTNSSVIKSTQQKKLKKASKSRSLTTSDTGDMSKRYLKYEGFCYIYGNLSGYAVVDGGTKGGYLIQAIKSVMKQSNVTDIELNNLIMIIGNETLQLVQGKGNKKQEKRNKMVRQIVERTININRPLYFVKKEQTNKGNK